MSTACPCYCQQHGTERAQVQALRVPTRCSNELARSSVVALDAALGDRIPYGHTPREVAVYLRLASRCSRVPGTSVQVYRVAMSDNRALALPSRLSCAA